MSEEGLILDDHKAHPWVDENLLAETGQGDAKP